MRRTATRQPPRLVTFLARRDGVQVPRIVSDVTGWGERIDGTFDTTVGTMTPAAAHVRAEAVSRGVPGVRAGSPARRLGSHKGRSVTLAAERPQGGCHNACMESCGLDTRRFLRQTVATLAYRAAKVLRDAPEGFGRLTISDTSRPPSAILGHLGDLMDWALSMARGSEAWREAPAREWPDGVRRFFDSLAALDGYLASDATLACSADRLFQGPIADALTHVGQIAMLRRVAASPVRGENYFRADIAVGRVGVDQAPPRREFD